MISLALSAFFFYAFYIQYYVWRDCFNELGRCYDPASGIVFLEQSGFIWSSLGALFAIPAIYLFARSFK